MDDCKLVCSHSIRFKHHYTFGHNNLYGFIYSLSFNYLYIGYTSTHMHEYKNICAIKYIDYICATHSSVSGYNSVAEGVAWETMFCLVFALLSCKFVI